MAWDKGFNFRSSSGYVTDGTNTTYVLPGDTYTGSTIRNGVAFGWVSGAVDARDRNSGIDPRLAGICFNSDGSPMIFRVVLPSAGDYDIRLAIGDYTSDFVGNTCVVKDNTTTKITIGPHNTTADNWYDATDAQRLGNATWVSANAASSQTFASTTLNIELSGSFGSIAHLFLSQTSGGAAPTSGGLLLMGAG